MTTDQGNTAPVNEPDETLPSAPYLFQPGSTTATSLYIDGQWRAARDGKVREILDPADNSVLTVVSEGTRADGRVSSGSFTGAVFPGSGVTNSLVS